jgi:hypothetical protein
MPFCTACGKEIGNAAGPIKKLSTSRIDVTTVPRALATFRGDCCCGVGSNCSTRVSHLRQD